MKRTATLVAGLLLVTGTVFAEGKLDFSGTVIKAKTKLITTTDANVSDDSNGDTDAVLQLKYNLTDNTSATFKFDTDSEDDTYDDDMEILLKTVQGKVEAQFDAGLSFKNEKAIPIYDPSGTQTGYSAIINHGTRFAEDQDSSDTYIKYNHTDNMSVAFYPFNMGLGNGSEFDETDSYTEIPGLVLTAGNAYVGFGMESADVDTDSVAAGTQKESVMAVKAGYEMTSGDTKVALKYSGAFWDKDKLEDSVYTNVLGTAGQLGPVVHDVNVHAELKLAEKFSVVAEAGINVLYDDIEAYVPKNGTLSSTNGKEDIKTGYGVSVKGTYALSDKVAPYAQVKYTTDGFLAYGDMEDWNVNNQDKVLYTGGVLELIGGVDYKLTDKLTLTGEAKFQNAGEEMFSDEDGNAYKESTAMTLEASATFTF